MRKTVMQVLNEVAAERNVPLDALISHRRRKILDQIRMEAYYRVFTECPHISFTEMGRRIGGRDHSTIHYGLQKHLRRIGLSYDDALATRGMNAFVSGQKSVPRYQNFRALMACYSRTMEAARHAGS